MGEDPARQELAELLLHELRQAGAVGCPGGLAEECFQVPADDRVEQSRSAARGRYVAAAGGMSLRYCRRPAPGNAEKTIRRYGRQPVMG